MRLRLAPLRERREDIPALITHFLNRHGNQHRVPDEVMDMLVAYNWPGNVRELEHTVQQMVAMNSGPWLSPADLPTAVTNQRAESQINSASDLNSSLLGGPSVTPLAELERRAILQAIEYTKGDRTLPPNCLASDEPPSTGN